MPYGIRFIAQQLRVELNKQFPSQNSEDEERIDKVVGNFVYYRYMNPAIVAPEGFDVIEQLISPLQRKNLAEISKMLQQIAVNRKFEGDQIHLSPMNDYVVKSADKMTSYFRRVTDIPSADDHFQMSNLYDFAKTSKPVIYISPQEIFNLHALLVETIDDIVKDENDILRRLLKEIPVPPIISVDYSGRKKESEVIETEASSKTNNEISLILSSRFADTMSSELFGAATAESITEYRNQFLEAKRYILSVIRIQGGKNLLDILERPCELRDEKQYEEFLSLERKKDLRRNASTEESQEQPKNDYPEYVAIPLLNSECILFWFTFTGIKCSEK
jgi:Ras GTPase-activating-like protein IQGAP2/3